MLCYHQNTEPVIVIFGPKMIVDAVEYVRWCKACQIHTNFIYHPSELLHPIITSWPFEAWRFDIIGPISRVSTIGHQLILIITDYFS